MSWQQHMKGQRPKHHKKCNGPIRRTTQALADKFGIKRKYILFGFIFGAIINFPLALIVFLVAMFWADHPEKVERKAAKFEQKVYQATDKWKQHFHQPKYATAGGAGFDSNAPRSNAAYEDLDFADLRAQFDDLERRTIDMEEHVSGEEYRLNKEFRKMKDQD